MFGNFRIFSGFFRDFFLIFLEFFFEEFFWGFFGRIFWWEFFVYTFKVSKLIWIWKGFMLCQDFVSKKRGKDKKFRSLEVRSKLIAIKNCLLEIGPGSTLNVHYQRTASLPCGQKDKKIHTIIWTVSRHCCVMISSRGMELRSLRRNISRTK